MLLFGFACSPRRNARAHKVPQELVGWILDNKNLTVADLFAQPVSPIAFYGLLSFFPSTSMSSSSTSSTAGLGIKFPPSRHSSFDASEESTQSSGLPYSSHMDAECATHSPQFPGSQVGSLRSNHSMKGLLEAENGGAMVELDMCGGTSGFKTGQHIVMNTDSLVHETIRRTGLPYDSNLYHLQRKTPCLDMAPFSALELLLDGTLRNSSLSLATLNLVSSLVLL